MKHFYCNLDCDLQHFERVLATRDFWDDLGHEWSYSTLDEKLVFLGVFSGFEDGTFRPDSLLTRAQIAKLLTEMS